MRIIEFIKRLFHREKPIEIKQKKDLNPPKKMKQTYVAKSTNYLDEQLDLFKTIQPGHLVFCRMPVCEDNLVDINNPHRIRPFLIIKKDKEYLYGYAGSTKKKNPKIQYTLKDGHKDKKTGTFSDSYLYLNNVYRIPIQNIKGILKQVSNKDLIQIQRKIKPDPHGLKYIFNMNVNRYVNKQLKKENKEVLELKEDAYISRNVSYYNYYPIGTILKDINTDEAIVYLFHYQRIPRCAKMEELYNDSYSVWQFTPKYFDVEDELTINGIKDMLEGFLSKKSRMKEVNKPFIPILEMEYKKLKKQTKKVR